MAHTPIGAQTMHNSRVVVFNPTQPDTISALWVAADLDSRPGTTFVDVVDFCFNCVLFMEREKEARESGFGCSMAVVLTTPDRYIERARTALCTRYFASFLA